LYATEQSGTPITSVVITDDQKQIVFGRSDGAVGIWPLGEQVQLYSLVEFDKAIPVTVPTGDGRSLQSQEAEVKAYRPLGSGGTVHTLMKKGEWAISSWDDGTIIIWDIRQGRALYRLIGHEGPVRTVTSLHHEEQVATGGVDGTIWMWDLTTEQVSG